MCTKRRLKTVWSESSLSAWRNCFSSNDLAHWVLKHIAHVMWISLHIQAVWSEQSFYFSIYSLLSSNSVGGQPRPWSDYEMPAIGAFSHGLALILPFLILLLSHFLHINIKILYMHIQTYSHTVFIEPQREKMYLWHVRPTKTQISLRIRAVWFESSLSAWKNFASFAIQNVPSEDSDQTARIRRLIWIFAGRTCPTVCFLMLWLSGCLPEYVG